MPQSAPAASINFIGEGKVFDRGRNIWDIQYSGVHALLPLHVAAHSSVHVPVSQRLTSTHWQQTNE